MLVSIKIGEVDAAVSVETAQEVVDLLHAVAGTPKKRKKRKKRNPPLRIPLPFDDAVSGLLAVNPKHLDESS